MLTVDGQRATYVALHDLAHELTGGRWVATGGGGYSVVDVVPRAWSHLLAIVAGRPLDAATETPGDWREHVRTSLQRTPPYRLTDGRNPAWRRWEEGFNPDVALDRAIHATRTRGLPAAWSGPLAVSLPDRRRADRDRSDNPARANRHAEQL